jgi:Zn finger protein HypA/HybF involved in hydrogenase expression
VNGENMNFPKQKTPVKCEKCGYTWTYKGKLRRTTCPNCGNKTRTVNQETPNLSTPKEDLSLDMLKKYLEG